MRILLFVLPVFLFAKIYEVKYLHISGKIISQTSKIIESNLGIKKFLKYIKANECKFEGYRSVGDRVYPTFKCIREVRVLNAQKLIVKPPTPKVHINFDDEYDDSIKVE